MWIDTHCHPFSKPYKQDVDEIIQRARDEGVEKMIVVGYNQDANRRTLELCEKYDFIYGSLGVHPCDCDQLTDEELDWIRENAKSEKIVAIGEMGLDFHHMSFSKEVQIETFRRQIRLANELDLPCVVHSRDSADESLAILLEEKAKKAIFHCFTYDLEFAKKVWEKGYFVSFSGVVTYPKAVDVQEVAKNAVLDLILLETDCPYLPPQSVRGKRNEMAYVIEVGEKVAELRGISANELAKQTTANAENLFGIAGL